MRMVAGAEETWPTDSPKTIRDTAEDSDEELPEELYAAVALVPEKRYTGTSGRLSSINLAADTDSMQTA